MGFLKDFAAGALTYGVKSLEADGERERKMEEAKALAEYKAKIDAQAELLKEQLKERREQREAEKAIAIESSAEQSMRDKGFEKFRRDVGESAMTPEQLREVYDKQYHDQDFGFEGGDRYEVKGSDLAREQLQQAMKAGAGSGLLTAYREGVKTSLKDEKDEREYQRKTKADEAKEAYYQGMLGVRQQGVNIQQQRVGLEGRRVGIAEDRAASGGSSGGGSSGGGGKAGTKTVKPADLTKAIRAVTDDAAMELGVKPGDLNTELKKLQTRASRGDQASQARLEALQPKLDELRELRAQQVRAQSSQAAASPKPEAQSKAQKSKAPPSIAEVKGAPAGSTIGALVPGKGWEVKDRSGKLLGYAKD